MSGFVERDFVTPKVVLSACLELEACRHDGQRIADSFLRRLMPFVEMVPICPEVEIGLGVPRDTIRLVGGERGETRMVQPSTQRDLTEAMERFAERFLASLPEVDGFILKAGSPSCGTADVKVYRSADRGAPSLRKESGLFAAAVLKERGDLAVESEGRLRNFPIRHHFLTQLYAFADLRQTVEHGDHRRLMDFQRRHKHLLMTYDQNKMRALGAIAAGAGADAEEEVFSSYEKLFRQALAKMPEHQAYINSLTHMYGHFKKEVNSSESAEFFALLEEYRHHRLPLHALLAVMRTWVSRHEYEYFADQSLLEPYPRALVQMRDSGKGVDF